jgi:hypothetical protein
MKKVRNATVTAPTMKLSTPFVTEIAAPDNPSSLLAPPFFT